MFFFQFTIVFTTIIIMHGTIAILNYYRNIVALLNINSYDEYGNQVIKPKL